MQIIKLLSIHFIFFGIVLITGQAYGSSEGLSIWDQGNRSKASVVGAGARNKQKEDIWDQGNRKKEGIWDQGNRKKENIWDQGNRKKNKTSDD